MKKYAWMLVLSLITASVLAQKSPQPKAYPGYVGDKKLYYGAAYYPEHWPESEIDRDIARMKELNMNVMRIGEFAWSTMEPQEGQYNFGWLHRVIEKLHQNGISTVLGTPTATPPVWLVNKYPGIMRTYANGEKAPIGMRRDVSYSSEVYRRECVRICEKMAQEFGKKPGVIAWQTDNEFNHEADYSPETKAIWQAWLQKRYGTIDKLNAAWGTMLWSQTYPDFASVPMPNDKLWLNPSHLINWHRFTNEQLVEFQAVQVAAVRKHSPLPITHDGMPGQDVDYQSLFRNLDFMAINNYHSFEAYDLIQSNYDRMRGFGKGYHWLFETAPNYSGGGNKGSAWFLHQPDGSMRTAMWMNHALGAQGTMFWLWRQHRNGQEMTHGSVVSSWGKPAANWADLKALGAELKKSSDFLMNNPVSPAQIAMVWHHEGRVALGIEKYANDISYYQDWTYRFYQPLAQTYLHRDVIAPEADLSRYKMLVVPLLPILPEELRTRLQAWVKAGGTLIIGPMTGYRNPDFAGYPDAATGDLETWTGISTESRLPIGVNPRKAEVPNGLRFAPELGLKDTAAYLVSDALASAQGKVLATYTTGMHKGKAAVIETSVGKGTVIVLGTDPGTAFLKKLFLQRAHEQGISPVATGESGCVVVSRGAKGTAVVNISNAPKALKLAQGGTDLLSGQKVGADLKLKPYEVLLLQH